MLIGFAFKVSAVPFHTWAPDTYEGAPTPIAAFLAVASKAAGFTAILQLIFVGFSGGATCMNLMWVLAVLTMTVGNLIALRQTNVVRLLAYSSVAQVGFMIAPLAVAGDEPGPALTAVITYMLIYAAMNLGAFAVVIAVARKTRSAEIDTFGGLFEYAPGLTVCLTVFLFALAGIPRSAVGGQVRGVPWCWRRGPPGDDPRRRRRGELGDRASTTPTSPARCGCSRCPTATARPSACRQACWQPSGSPWRSPSCSGSSRA